MYIQEAAQSLLTAALNGSQLPNITERARQYILRCEELKKIGKCDYIRIKYGIYTVIRIFIPTLF